MQAILSAMQEDTIVGREMAKASHELAQEMKRDSVAMRTVRTKCFMKTFFFTNVWLLFQDRCRHDVFPPRGNICCEFQP